MSLDLSSSDVFLMTRLRLWVWGRRATEGIALLITSHQEVHSLTRLITDAVSLGHLPGQCLPGCSTVKLLLSPLLGLVIRKQYTKPSCYSGVRGIVLSFTFQSAEYLCIWSSGRKICLFPHLFASVQTHASFILWLIFWCCGTLLLMMCLLSFCVPLFEYFLTFCPYEMLQAHLVLFLPRLQNQPFVRGTLVPFLGEWYFKMEIWVLGVSVASRVSLLSRPSQLTELGNVCEPMYVHISAVIVFVSPSCPYSAKPELILMPVTNLLILSSFQPYQPAYPVSPLQQ